MGCGNSAEVRQTMISQKETENNGQGKIKQAASTKNFSWQLPVQNRLQWETNNGYCGETSAIIAGLMYGQYFSQYDMREIGAPFHVNFDEKDKTWGLQKFEYLVGENDLKCHEETKTTVERNDQTDTSADHAKNFLVWVKKMVKQGYPVTITVFVNQNTGDDEGQLEYDHIVPVNRIDSQYDDEEYHEDDIIIFYDNYEKTKYQEFTFKNFQATRQQANQPERATYSLPCEEGIASYGIAHTGLVGDDLLPVRIDPNINHENHATCKQGSNERPEANTVVITVTVSKCDDPEEEYILYRYDDEKKVPIEEFNSNSGNAISCVTFKGNKTGIYQFTETIESSDKVIYRCTRASAH